MKKRFNFIFVSLLSLVLCVPFFHHEVKANEENRMEDGLSFTASSMIHTNKALEMMPKTFEAYIKVPTSLSKRPGIIFGNYGPDNTTACYSFEVQWDSNLNTAYPKLYYDVDNVGTTNPGVVNINFKEVDLRSENYVHLAITHDTTYIEKDGNKYTVAKCYVDGVLRQTVETQVSTNIATYYDNYNFVPSTAGRVGGDYRGDNAQYFKGNIKSIELYKDVRLDNEIQDDATRLLGKPTDTDLLAGYNFTQEKSLYLKDLSSNGYNLIDTDNLLDSYDGKKFNQDDRHVLKNKFTNLPHTFESTLFIPKNYASRVGVILGNYGNGSSLSFEINTNGRPRLFYTSKVDNSDKSIIFDGVDVRGDDFVHLAITHDLENSKVYCYLNGELKAESSLCEEYIETIAGTNFVVGGDNRSGNEQFFKGALKSVTAFSDVRTAEEIKKDYNESIDLTDENLLVHYELSDTTGNLIEDLSANKNNAKVEVIWFSEKEEVKDYAYSFAVVGDTQIVCRKDPQYMKTIYNWILDNKETKNIQHVFGLGDITDANSNSEWLAAGEAVGLLDGNISYSLNRGNHDSSKNFFNTFGHSAYMEQFDGFYSDEDINSGYMTMTIGETDYLFFTLDYGASDDVLAWAGEIIDQHINHKVIITTHCYMFRDGTTLSTHDVCSPADSNDTDNGGNRDYNNGDEMWDEFVSQYGNIVLVLSGHDPCENVVTRQTEGIHGNIVTQMLMDPQGVDSAIGSTGMVGMLYFNEDGSQMEVEYYSTVKNQYYKESNQYIVDMLGSGKCAHNLDYNHDDNKHWTTCDCGYASDDEKHNYDEGVVTLEPTLEQEGVKTYTCECGAQKVESIPKLEPIPEPTNNPMMIYLIIGGVVVLGGAVTSIFIFKKKKS